MNQLPSDSRCGAEAAEPAFLALVATADRCAMEQLYVRYFARLAAFFHYMTFRVDVVEELINDTILEAWKTGVSMRTNAALLPAILRLAYSRLQQHFAEVRANELNSQSAGHDWEHATSQLTKATRSDIQIFLSRLPVEERAVVYFVYASGCSRRETADVMEIGCDRVDLLIRAVGASATLYYCPTSAHAQ